jgi:hypothetical protein
MDTSNLAGGTACPTRIFLTRSLQDIPAIAAIHGLAATVLALS